MADTAKSEHDLLGVRHLLWGNEIKLDIFKRWSQGALFNDARYKTALKPYKIRILQVFTSVKRNGAPWNNWKAVLAL